MQDKECQHSTVRFWPCASLLALAAAGFAAQAQAQPLGTPQSAAQRCAALVQDKSVADGRIESATLRADGYQADLGFGGMKSAPLPTHCEVLGILHERVGRDGDHYAIRFHLRLPEAWNSRFFFEGGGGTDGNIGAALGQVSFTAPPLLARGFAVVSDDSGHSNALNNDPALGGPVSFGRDPQARADYGHAALKATYDAAKAIIARFYTRSPMRSYFVGCSKGGQEGLAFAERYPEAFDGIVAGAPGMSLPRAALSHPWSTQVFGALVGGDRKTSLPAAKLADSFSNDDLKLARRAVLAACDADDGLTDGIVGATTLCTAKKVDAELHKIQCKGDKTSSCLSSAQIAALDKFYGGPKNSKGKALYASFPWDAGMADAGWRAWTIGSPPVASGIPGASGPPISVTMGAGSLAEVFTTPARIVPPGVQSAMDYLMSYDFDHDAPAIYATTADFPRSAWDDINARSPDLDAFAKHGGKLIIYHGASDPVFSLNDTLAWWTEVDARMKGHAADTLRVFPVPGMGHCMGGPATDQFDAFGALVDWVEQSKAPNRLEASAGPATPWPGRTRPLCSYPAVGRYDGKGDVEKSGSFVCAAPSK